MTFDDDDENDEDEVKQIPNAMQKKQTREKKNREILYF